MDVTQFFARVWSSYLNDLSLAEQVQAAAPLMVYTLASFWGLRRVYKGYSKHLLVELEEEKESSRKWLKKYNEVNSRIAIVEKHLPEHWMRSFAVERKAGNEERALGTLRDQFREAAPHLATAADELAEYHTSVSFDLGSDHLEEARRYCRLAILHGGHSKKRGDLLLEIDLSLSEITDVETVEYEDWSDLFSAFSASGEIIELIATLNEITHRKLKEGRIRTARIVNERALLLSKRSVREDFEVAKSRILKANILSANRQEEEALTEVDLILSMYLDPLPQHHTVIVSARLAKAQILNSLMRHQEALHEVDSVLSMQSATLSLWDHSSFYAHYVRASILSNKGDGEVALAEIDCYLPRQKELLGSDDFDVLAGRSLRALVLSELERYNEALIELDDLSAAQERLLTIDNPWVQRSYFLRARILKSCGRYQEALKQVEAFEDAEIEAVGKRHPDALVTRFLKAQILSNLGMHEKALEHLEEVAAIQPLVLPESHPDIEATQNLRREVLVKIHQEDIESSRDREGAS